MLLDDIETICRVLLRERRWREGVFARNPTRRDAKLAEVDEALAALGRIEGRLRELGEVIDPPRQMELFASKKEA